MWFKRRKFIVIIIGIYPLEIPLTSAERGPSVEVNTAWSQAGCRDISYLLNITKQNKKLKWTQMEGRQHAVGQRHCIWLVWSDFDWHKSLVYSQWQIYINVNIMANLHRWFEEVHLKYHHLLRLVESDINRLLKGRKNGSGFILSDSDIHFNYCVFQYVSHLYLTHLNEILWLLMVERCTALNKTDPTTTSD